MLDRVNGILSLWLFSYLLSILLYPLRIRFLRFLHIQKEIRLTDSTGQDACIFRSLHVHKSGTPTMGGGLFLIIMGIVILISVWLRKQGFLTYDFLNERETGLLFVGFFGMGIIGLLDDIFNILKMNKIRGLSARPKLGLMFIFAGRISYWFVRRLGIVTVNFWPLGGDIYFHPFLAWWIYFLFILFVTNAINITDGLDGLAGGLMIQVLSVIAVIAFFDGKFLTTGMLASVMAILAGFLWFNINPARVFMGDSGAFSLGGLLAVSVLLINIHHGIFIPFLLLFGLFIFDAGSSVLQIFSKKFFGRKLFPIAPFHHLLEHRGNSEATIVMKWRLIQVGLASATLIIFFYQIRLIQ